VEYGYNNANEMTSAGGINYTYDGNGNLSTKGNFTYSWDYRNQLTGVVGQGFSLANVYDGDGRRVQSRSTFDARLTTVNYLWDGMNTILEFSDTGTVTDEYLNGAGEILGKIRYLPSGITQKYYYLHDGLGSTTYLLDNYGNIVNAYYYEPFGRCWNVEHDPGHNTRFTGKEYEEDIGLYYFCARWYDADAGRFISRDIISGNYIYVSNNPIIFLDPTGFQRALTREERQMVDESISYLKWAVGVDVKHAYAGTKMMLDPSLSTREKGPAYSESRGAVPFNRSVVFDDSLFERGNFRKLILTVYHESLHLGGAASLWIPFPSKFSEIAEFASEYVAYKMTYMLGKIIGTEEDMKWIKKCAKTFGIWLE